MRVTQSMLSSDVLRQISNSYQRMATYQQQLASGKKITLPSQDPVVAVMGISYRTDVNHIDQYQRNVANAYQWLDSSDSALGQLNSEMQRIRELTVQAANGSNTPSDLQSINKEIEQVKQQLVDVGNTRVAGRYIFNGQRTDTPPLNFNPGNPSTVTVNTAASQNNYSIEVNNGVEIPVNVDPTTVFTQKMFDDISALQAKLSSGSPATAISQSISDIDSHLSQISAARAELGARTDRMDMVKNRLTQQSDISTKIMATNEDADYASTLIKLNQEQSVHQAALSVGARIMQQTLVDFLR